MKKDLSFADRPRARSDLEISESRKDGKVEHYVLMDSKADESFLLRPVEQRIFLLLDGTRGIDDVASAVMEENPSLNLDNLSVSRFVNELKAKGLLDESNSEFHPGSNEKGRHKPWFIYYKLPLFQFERLIGDRIVNRFRYRRGTVLISYCAGICLTVLLAVIFSGRAHLWDTSIMYGVNLFDPDRAALLYGILLFSAVLHELGHGMALRLFGGRVGEIGVIFFFCQPLFYCNTNAAWLLTKRTERALVSAAGTLADFAVALIVFFSYLIMSLFGVYPAILLSVSMLMLAKIAVNLIPFFRLDGYFVLSDLVGEHNLMKHSLFFLFKRLKGIPLTPAVRSRGTLYFSYCAICAISFLVLSLAIFLAGREAMTGTFTGDTSVANALALVLDIPILAFLLATVKKYWYEFRSVHYDVLY